MPPAQRAARAQQARLLRLLPGESQRSGAQACYTRKPPHEVRDRAGTWKHGLASKKGGVSLVQHSCVEHEVIPASAARRARSTGARAAPSPQREPAQWRASALHVQATSRSEGQGWHVGVRPCTEEGRLLASAAPFRRTRIDPRKRARRGARAQLATGVRVADPPQGEPAQWRASALHAQATS